MKDSILTPKIDQNIGFQIQRLLREAEAAEPMPTHPTITLSREFGCEGFPVAEELSRQLQSSKDEWVVFHRKLLEEMSETDEYRSDLLDAVSDQNRGQIRQYLDHLLSHKPTNYSYYKSMAEHVRILAEKGKAIVVGSGGAIVTRGLDNVFHVRLKASEEFRIKRIAGLLDMSYNQARRKVEQTEENREEFVKEFTKQDITDPAHYHLIIDNEAFDARMAANVILHAMKQKKLL